MKKVIFSLCFLFTVLGSYAQKADTSKTITKIDYIQKSKNKKTAAFVLLGVGAALDIGGIIATISNANRTADNIISTGGSEVNRGTELALYIAGTTSLLGSLPFFISAKLNKQRALSLTFKNELARELQNTMVFYKVIPAIGLKLNF